MLQEGLYLAENTENYLSAYRIVLQVKETPKSYILIKKEYENRYSYSHIATMFGKADRIVLRKQRNPHPFRVWDDHSFTIYPFQAGIPFYFKMIEIWKNSAGSGGTDSSRTGSSCKIYEFTEHTLTVSGERHDLIQLAACLRNAEGTLGDLRYKIEYAFDIDSIRFGNKESEDANSPDYAEQYLRREKGGSE